MKQYFKNYYDSKEGIKEYSEMLELQKPEKIILKHIKNKRILDIGTGRTTKFFYPLTKEYIGIDYSEGRINKAKEVFPKANIFVYDAREMWGFKDNYFDVIVFSFNGIDSVNYEDRLKILKEIKRVGKRNALFLFSSHNLLSLKKRFISIPSNISLSRKLKLLIKKAITIIINKSFNKITKSNFIIINHFVKKMILSYAYINPKYQIEQLEENGFKNIETYSIKDGKIIKDLNNIQDIWIYYLCKVKK